MWHLKPSKKLIGRSSLKRGKSIWRHLAKAGILGWWKLWIVITALCLTALKSLAVPRSPFEISVAVKSNSPQSALLIDFKVPPNCVLYAERLHFQTDAGDEIVPSLLPNPVSEIDKASGKEKLVYEHSFYVELSGAASLGAALVVKFQGCTNAECFFPEKRVFARGADGIFAELREDT